MHTRTWLNEIHINVQRPIITVNSMIKPFPSRRHHFLHHLHRHRCKNPYFRHQLEHPGLLDTAGILDSRPGRSSTARIHSKRSVFLPKSQCADAICTGTSDCLPLYFGGILWLIPLVSGPSFLSAGKPDTDLTPLC